MARGSAFADGGLRMASFFLAIAFYIETGFVSANPFRT